MIGAHVIHAVGHVHFGVDRGVAAGKGPVRLAQEPTERRAPVVDLVLLGTVRTAVSAVVAAEAVQVLRLPVLDHGEDTGETGTLKEKHCVRGDCVEDGKCNYTVA